MRNLLLKGILLGSIITAIFFSAVVTTTFSGCKKHGTSATDTLALAEQLFDANIINRNFIISFASNTGTDITSSYSGYIFVLQKIDYYHGPLQVIKGTNTYTGTWSCNSDYSQIIITLPSPPAEFGFLSRAWRFTKKDVPELHFAPWGTNDPYILYMYQQ